MRIEDTRIVHRDPVPLMTTARGAAGWALMAMVVVLAGQGSTAMAQTSGAASPPPSLTQDPMWQMDDRMAMMEAEIALLRRQNELSQLRRALGALTDDGGLPRVISIGIQGLKRAWAAQIRTPDGDSGLFKVGDVVGNWRIQSIEAQQVLVVPTQAGRSAAADRTTKLPMESMTAALERQRSLRAGATAGEAPRGASDQTPSSAGRPQPPSVGATGGLDSPTPSVPPGTGTPAPTIANPPVQPVGVVPIPGASQAPQGIPSPAVPLSPAGVVPANAEGGRLL